MDTEALLLAMSRAGSSQRGEMVSWMCEFKEMSLSECVLTFLSRWKEGTRVVVYHIQGCGSCHLCRQGLYISCEEPERRAYGWQRDGGHGE